MSNKFEYHLTENNSTPSVFLLMQDDNQDTMISHSRKPDKEPGKPMELHFPSCTATPFGGDENW